MKPLTVLIILVLVQTVKVRADIPPNEADEILVAITNLHLTQTSIAYRSAVGPRMLEEANYFSGRLKLPPPHPITVTDIVEFRVSPPLYSMDEELGRLMKEDSSAKSVIARLHTAKIVVRGSIETTNFCFSFNRGYLWYVANRINHDERFSMYAEWAKTSSLIDSNGAVQLATQWLASVDVDVAALNKKNKPKVEQQWFWNQPGLDVYHPPGDTNKTMLPIFEVTWGTNEADYPAEVEILGTTKELMKLHLGDFSLSHRPLLVVTNAVELNNIPDPPVKRLQSLPKVQTNSAVPP